VLTAPRDLQEGTLRETLRESWAIRARSLNYLAVGWGSHHWEVRGEDRTRWFVTVDELEVADRVHFIGEIPPWRMADFLACLDVFVFPSQAETFGLAAVEAANAGVPSVVNDLPVLREVLSFEGKPTALFVDASDNAKLSAAVSSILTNQTLRDELRQNAKGLKSLYSVDTMVEEYVQILSEAI